MKLYSNNNKYVYKFPIRNNKKSFICVSINVKFLKSDTPKESTNVKFCFIVSIKERNIEWVSKPLKLKNNEISIILSIPEMAIKTNKILTQMKYAQLQKILLIMK